MEYVGSDNNNDDVNERNTCPLACFGSDNGSDDDDTVVVPSSVEAKKTTTADNEEVTSSSSNDLAKSRQLCNTSNANRPMSLGPIIDNSCFIIFDTSTLSVRPAFSLLPVEAVD
jgi:hypothetical protein